MEASSRSQSSRRSFPNLNHLSLAPLSSRFPIDDDGYDEDESIPIAPQSSYIQSRTAPNTPGILAGGPNRQKRKSKKRAFAHESYFPSEAASLGVPLIKAKSSSALLAQNKPASLVNGPTAPLSTLHRSRHSIQGNDEWLHRAGLTIASETRESKGQSWLVSRESSTSLVQQGERDEEQGHYDQVDNDYLASDQASRRASRVASRAGSAKTSRRGSRTGSKVDFITPFDAKLPAEGYFDSTTMEPDFVDRQEDEGSIDDEEVAKLSKVQGFGLGSLVDRLVGWPLFNVDEDTEDEALEGEEAEAGRSPEEVLKRKEAQLKRRREQLARTASSSASATMQRTAAQRQQQAEEGGWQDAAWLLSVASKVLL